MTLNFWVAQNGPKSEEDLFFLFLVLVVKVVDQKRFGPEICWVKKNCGPKIKGQKVWSKLGQ